MKGLLLINIGTPDASSPEGPSVAEVRRYLGQFLMDPFVVDIPWVFRALLVHGIILRTRPKKSREAYHQIWTKEGSPLLVHSFAFAKIVTEHLKKTHAVALGMCNGNPSIAAGLQQLRNHGVSEIIVAPLFPQYAEATHAGSFYLVDKNLKKMNWKPSVKKITHFYEQDFFIQAQAQEIRAVVDAHRPQLVLFSYHGLPERQIKKADPTKKTCLQLSDCCAQFQKHHPLCYRAQCFKTTEALVRAAGIGAGQSMVSFQSRLGRTKWIGPNTEDVLAQMPKKGIKNILIVSPSFVADCLETLEELSIRGKETFLEAGGTTYNTTACVNSRNDWSEGFGDWIQKTTVT